MQSRTVGTKQIRKKTWETGRRRTHGKKRFPVKNRLIPLFLFSLIFVGCSDIDLFNQLGTPIANGYRIEHSENKDIYFIIKKNNNIFEGIIRRAGSNDKVLIADVEKNYEGDKSGVFLLEFDTGDIEGPLSQSEITTQLNIHSLTLEPVSEYFGSLK